MPPVAKRIEERRRRNIVPGETVATMHGAVAIPELAPGQHPVAVAWYEAVKISGQALFFEPTDWAAAMYAANLMTRSLQDGAPASLAATALAAMNDLLTTEKSRRQAKLQVQRILDEQPESDTPTPIDEYRKALGG
jgi:hypothetical protein